MITYPCGCRNEIAWPDGPLRSVAKCAAHAVEWLDPTTLDEPYYAAFGVIKDGKAVTTEHAAQLAEAVGPFPRAAGSLQALEIGCGVSPYFDAIEAAGWAYLGCDVSHWAARWMRTERNASVAIASWETWRPLQRYGLILCAHTLEHMTDVRAAVRKMVDVLERDGDLFLITPDDTDPVNPDHLWYFSPDSLRRLVRDAGLEVTTMARRRYIERENFLYLRARKPA